MLDEFEDMDPQEVMQSFMEFLQASRPKYKITKLEGTQTHTVKVWDKEAKRFHDEVRQIPRGWLVTHTTKMKKGTSIHVRMPEELERLGFKLPRRLAPKVQQVPLVDPDEAELEGSVVDGENDALMNQFLQSFVAQTQT